MFPYFRLYFPVEIVIIRNPCLRTPIPLSVPVFIRRRGDRVVEGAALEKRCARKGTAGSNPALSVPLSRDAFQPPPLVIGEVGGVE